MLAPARRLLSAQRCFILGHCEGVIYVTHGLVPGPGRAQTLARLMDEGLDRHEAVHAIGSVLMSIVFDVVSEANDGGDINEKYSRALATLTAANWRSQVG